MGGPAELVIRDLLEVMNASSKLGLKLNPKKCELLVMGECDPESIELVSSLLPGLKMLEPISCSLLGVPLTPEALPGAISSKTECVPLLLDRLPSLQSHFALFLMKNCLAIPKLVYLVRCCPTWTEAELLRQLDSLIRNALQSLLNLQIDNSTWAQASLPVSRGGIGIRSTHDLSVPAFLASTSCTLELVSHILAKLPVIPDLVRDEALLVWYRLSGETNDLSFKQQRAWEFPILEKLSSLLLESASSQSDQARLRACMRKESGAWLNALPSPPLGTLMDNDTLRVSLCLRLGTKMCHPHLCRCGSSVDAFGTHGLSCQKSAGRLSRHFAINDILKRACASINVPAILEPSGLFREDGKKPDGLTLIPWSKGKCLLWDATCVDTLARSYISATSRLAGSAALKAEVKKSKKYFKAVSSLYIFCPFAVETFGTFGEEALNLVKELGSRLQVSSGETRSTAFLTQRISIAIQRGNAASVFATIPSSLNLYETFYLT